MNKATSEATVKNRIFFQLNIAGTKDSFRKFITGMLQNKKLSQLSGLQASVVRWSITGG